ncbi:MAG: aminotransferase class V-fold PLP-dependent enzyme [Lachnospiraceae bacterium]|nr:aminotransferase class V-fold PLP-dependent enzyme [Lachnospiraceae bacterium]
MSGIYLNNAATSYPKPDCVKELALKNINALPSGQFRSAGVSDNGDIFLECRRKLALILGVEESERIFFTSGATESLNTLLSGIGVNASEIITTVTEHNSVLRPLYNLPGIKGEPMLLPCDKEGVVSPGHFEDLAKTGRGKVLILNHCSNVNGTVQDAEAFGKIAKKYGLIYIIDASQSAGCMRIDADAWSADAIAFTGHKSLLGLQGSGGYYIRSGIPFVPMKYGGTGRDSEKLRYDGGDYEYETGTQNSLAIAALSEAARFILERGIENIEKRESEIRQYAKKRLSEIKGIFVFPSPEEKSGPVLSFSSEILPPSDISYILQNSYGIVTRSGLMCAPLMHEYIGSGKKGTVRISFSIFQKEEDIDSLCEALKEIHGDNG